jgi:prevent-host-death family protein
MHKEHVKVAELKARLSEYLRRVRRGRSLVVMDRDTPIARIVPYEGATPALRIRRPPPGAPRLGEIPLPPPLELDIDVVALLLEERQGER